MKRVLSFVILMLIVSVSFAQLNSTKPYTRTQTDARYERYLGNPSVSGYILSSTTSGVRTWVANGSGSMVYPSAGIALSTGSAWGTSITDNSVNWNTAYGWGNWAANFGTTTGTITQGNDSRLVGNVKTEDLVDPTSLIDSIASVSTINAQTASYTATISDLGKTITINSASATTFTMPLFSVVAFPLGTTINVIRLGAGDVTIAITATGTLQSESSWVKIGAQYSGVTLLKIATDTWVILGRLKA